MYKRPQNEHLDEEGTDWIACALCDHVGRSISRHVWLKHGLSKEEYVAKHGPVTCQAARTAYGSTGNFGWIERRKARGDDLREYRATMGKAVSAAILADPVERARRSELARTTIVSWARSDRGRKASSETAKRTSARPEVLVQRSENLRAWRKREPDAFYEKCVRSMHTFKTSKPERWLLAHLQEKHPEMGFKGNQRLMSLEHFTLTASHKRQIDIMSRSHKVIVEVDGYLHFHNIPQWDQLERTKAKDAELDRAASLMGYMLVRISYDQWDQATGQLSNDAAELLDMHIQLISPGVYRIGAVYPKVETVDDNSDRFEIALADLASRMGMTSMELLREAVS